MDRNVNFIDLRSDVPSPSNDHHRVVIDLRSDLPSPSNNQNMNVIDLRSDGSLPSSNNRTPSRDQTPDNLEPPRTLSPYLGDYEAPGTPSHPVSLTSSRTQSPVDLEPPRTPTPYISSEDEAQVTPTQSDNSIPSSPRTPAWNQFSDQTFDPFINEDDDDDESPRLPAHPRSFDYSDTLERDWSGDTQSEGTMIPAREAYYSGTEYGSDVEYDDERGIGDEDDPDGGDGAESDGEPGIEHQYDSDGDVLMFEGEDGDESNGERGVGYQDDSEGEGESDVEREPEHQHESGGGSGVKSGGGRGGRYQYDSDGNLVFGYQKYFESGSGVDYGDSSEYQVYDEHGHGYQDDSDGGDEVEYDDISGDEVNGRNEAESGELSGYESDIEPGDESSELSALDSDIELELGVEFGEIPEYESDVEPTVDFGEGSESEFHRRTKVESTKRLLTFEFEYSKVTAVAKSGNIEKAMGMIEDLRDRPDFTPFHNIMCLIMIIQVSPIENFTIKLVLEECRDICQQFRDFYAAGQNIPDLDEIETILDTVSERCKVNDQDARVVAATPNWEQFDEEMKTIAEAKIDADISAFVPTANNRAVSLRFETNLCFGTSLQPNGIDIWTDAEPVNCFQYRDPKRFEITDDPDDMDFYDDSYDEDGEDEDDDEVTTEREGEVEGDEDGEDDEEDESSAEEKGEVEDDEGDEVDEAKTEEKGEVEDSEDDEDAELTPEEIVEIHDESDAIVESDENFESDEDIGAVGFNELLSLF